MGAEQGPTLAGKNRPVEAMETGGRAVTNSNISKLDEGSECAQPRAARKPLGLRLSSAAFVAMTGAVRRTTRDARDSWLWSPDCRHRICGDHPAIVQTKTMR